MHNLLTCKLDGVREEQHNGGECNGLTDPWKRQANHRMESLVAGNFNDYITQLTGDLLRIFSHTTNDRIPNEYAMAILN